MKASELCVHPIFNDIKPHILSRFWVYHLENPNILELFLKYSRMAKAAGFKRYGSQSIQERIRWHVSVEKTGERFKMNDHYPSCYARLMIVLFPEEFEGFFELRSPQKRERIYKEMNYHGELE